MSKEAAGKSSQFFLWGWISTAVVLVIAGFVGWNAKPGSSIWPISNLTANEWGEFISGLAGSLAFIWLIVTVRIQANELELQRQDLAESREVARSQADFIGKQTAIFQEETEDRKNLATLECINSCEQQIGRLLNSVTFSGLAVRIIDKNGVPNDVDLAQITNRNEITLTDRSTVALKRCRQEIVLQHRFVGLNNTDDFTQLAALIDRVNGLSSTLPDFYQLRRAYPGEVAKLTEVINSVRTGIGP